MIFRTLLQGLLALSVLEFVPSDAATLERSAELPVAPLVSSLFSFREASPASESLPEALDRYPKKVDEESVGIVTSAQSVLVLDRASGLPLFKKNPEAVRSIGSITKLMTALVFLEAQPDLNASASVLPEDYREGGRLYLAMNDPLTMHDILRASLVGSDNTATMSLVRLSGMTNEDFVRRMNEKAVSLGMTHTSFADPTGLSAQNISRPWDITKLLNAVLATAEIQSTVTLTEVTIAQESGASVTIPSTDDLLQSFIHTSPYTILGGKTGYLPEAGYCIGIGVVREGEGEILVVLLGSDTKTTRVQEVKGLVEWAYRIFEWNQ